MSKATMRYKGRCSVCGKRKREIRSRCDHVRRYHFEGELLGRITWAPRGPDDEQPWKVESFNGQNTWWRSDDVVDAEYELTSFE